MKRFFVTLFVLLVLGALPALGQESLSAILGDINESEIVGSDLEFPLTMIMDTETVGINISTSEGVEQVFMETEDSTVTHFETDAYPGEPTMLITTSEAVLEGIAQTPEENRSQALLEAIENDDIKIEKTSGWENFLYGVVEWIGLAIASWFV